MKYSSFTEDRNSMRKITDFNFSRTKISDIDIDLSLDR